MPSPWGYTPTPQYGIASTVNPFMQTQARQALQANLPMYGQNVAQRGRNVSSFLQGEVPEDVLQQIQQRGAERGVATGMTGGPNVNAAWLRALGLTSLGLMGSGSEMLSKSIADTPVAELWNPMSLYVPERLAQQELAAAQAGTGSQKKEYSLSYLYPGSNTWQTQYRYFA